MLVRSLMKCYEIADRLVTLAIVTGEHVMITGSPGTGKSMFARRVFEHFEGEMFFTQLSKWSDESVLFGVPNFKELRENGRIYYDTVGNALSANFMFVDEVFDASDVLLRTLLGILNEREFSRGGFRVKVPLISCVATSNFTRINEVTLAVVDRFALFFEPRTMSVEEREELYDIEKFVEFKCAEKYTLDDISRYRSMISNCCITGGALASAMKIAEKYSFSPRRERKAASLIRASAVLDGRDVANSEDVANVLPYMVVSQNSINRENIRNEIVTMSKIVEDEIVTMSIINEIESNFRSSVSSSDRIKAMKNMAKLIRKLKSIHSKSDDVISKRDSLVEKIKSAHLSIMEDMDLIP